MFKRLIQRLFGSWPAGVPRLYPDEDEVEVCEFLSDRDYRRINSFEDVYILPFVSHGSSFADACFGAGLARLMIRNLMLLKDVSIHGPEDTFHSHFESVKEVANARRTSNFVSGIASVGDGFRLRLKVVRPGRATIETQVEHQDFRSFLRICTHSIGQALGSRLETTVEEGWEVGQPKGPKSLARCGELQVKFSREGDRAKHRAGRKALATDPDFVLPVWEMDSEIEPLNDRYLECLRRDPYNAQLCFVTFISLWRSKGHQPEAMQFCRRAIELSPGHGKAHMCAPHSAHPEAHMLRHSELGYRLLPGNPFAVNNYIINLRMYGAPQAKMLELAEEGIATDPFDPGNYNRLIEMYLDQADYEMALMVAERLQSLYEPVMNERALYCLKQNPEVARLLKSGRFDPASENQERIRELKRVTRGR